VVVEVEDPKTHEAFAMKVMLKSKMVRSRDKRRLKNELSVLRKLPPSRFLQRCHDAFHTSARLFFVVDLMEGGDLFFALVQRVKETGGGFEEPEARGLLSQVVLGLEHLHTNGFIHRDIKVENIMLDGFGHVKIIDFGLAIPLASQAVQVGGSEAKDGAQDQQPMSPTGSLIYMAPELLKEGVGGRHTDWWALGVLAHELLTGRSPWSSLTDKSLIQKEIGSMRVAPPDGVSPAAGKFVCALLHQTVSRRLGTAASSEVKGASFFKAVDFDACVRGTAEPALPRSALRALGSPSGKGVGVGPGGGLLSPQASSKSLVQGANQPNQPFDPAECAIVLNRCHELLHKGVWRQVCLLLGLMLALSHVNPKHFAFLAGLAPLAP